MVINRTKCEQSNNGKAGAAVSGLISIFMKGSLYLICITEKGLLGAGISQAQRPWLLRAPTRSEKRCRLRGY